MTPTDSSAPEGRNQSPEGGAPEIDRRTLVQQWLGYVLTGLATALLAVPLLGYLLGPLFRRKPDQWIVLGPVGRFPANQTRLVKFDNPDRQPLDGETGRVAAYVRRLEGTGEGDFQVFAVNCTHLGCPVQWFPQAGLFLCPCHGGVYYQNGDRASGPPPRGLYQYDHRIVQGNLQIRAGHMPTLHNTLKQAT